MTKRSLLNVPSAAFVVLVGLLVFLLSVRERDEFPGGGRTVPEGVSVLTYRAPTGPWEIRYPDRFIKGTIPPLPPKLSRLSVDGIWIANFDAPRFDPRIPSLLSRSLPSGGVGVTISQIFGGPYRSPDVPDSLFPISIDDFEPFPGDYRGVWLMDTVVANGDFYTIEVRIGPEATEQDQQSASEIVSSFRALPLREGTATGRYGTFFVLGFPHDYPVGSVTKFEESDVAWPSYSRPFPFYLVRVPEGFYALAGVKNLVGGYQDCDVSWDPANREFSCPDGARWGIDGSVIEKPEPGFPDDPLQVLLVRISLDGHVLVSPDAFMSDTRLDLRLTREV